MDSFELILLLTAHNIDAGIPDSASIKKYLHFSVNLYLKIHIEQSILKTPIQMLILIKIKNT